MKLPRSPEYVVLMAAFALAACTAGGPVGPVQRSIPEFVVSAGSAAAETAAPVPAAFLQMDEEMRAFVHEHVATVTSRLERMRRLTQVMLSPGYLGIRYEPDLTLTAGETFRQRAGNCLSFSALYLLMAREAGLDAVFQDVPVLPNWRKDGSAFVVERHINVRVRIGHSSYVIDFRPPAAVAYARARRISDQNATAQYLGNLGVERFTAADPAGAYQLFRRGLEVDPGVAPLWVNLGVVLGRNGQFDAATAAYETALALEPENLSALSNLAGLVEHRGDTERLQQLSRRIEDYRARNPYYQYWLGERRLQAGDPHAALRAFRAALRLMPTESDFHFALARTWRALGREDEARRSLAQALERAASESIRQRYIAGFAEPGHAAMQE